MPTGSAALAERLLAETITKHHIDRDQLALHADRGTSMASKPVAMLLTDLGVTKSHSRPHCSNDNPFSEAQVKTFNYRPDFPERFGSLADARSFCQRFFGWYNDQHRHSGIGLHTPADVHPTGVPPPSGPPAPRSCPPPTTPTASGSSASTPNHPRSPAPGGSTSQSKQLNESLKILPQKG